MISFFRRTLASKLALGLLALIILAFIITGVFTHEMPGTGAIGGAGGATAAEVGSRTVTVPELDDRVRRQFANFAQQQQGLTLPVFIAQGGYEGVVDQTISALALELFGRSIGLTASKRQIDGEIAGVQAFQGPNGKFDRQTYLSAIAQQHVSEPQLRSDIGGDIVRRMIYLPATGAMTLPDGLVRPYAALLTQERQGTIGLIPTAALAGGPPPTDAEIQSFYRAHIAAYTMPERRALRYAIVGRDQVAMTAIPAEAQIRKFYDANPQQYASRETRDLSQVVVDSQAKAQAFKAAVTSGKSFAEAASAIGFSAKDIAVGIKSQADYAQLSSSAVAAAAYAVADGGVSDPVKSDFGWHVVKVNAVQKIPATPYEKARAEIAGDLGKQMQDRALADLVGKLQDALDGGKGFADIVKANNLTVIETPALTQAGAAPDQPGYKPTPEIQPLLKPGFASGPDQPATLETIQQNERYALLSVGHVVPAAPLPIAQVKEKVAADFAAGRAADRGKAIATAILAKVKAGTPMAAAFAAAPVKLPPVQQGKARRIDLSRQQGPIPAGIQALFTLTVGHAKMVPAENGQGWFVVRLDAAAPGDPKLLPSLVSASRGDLVQAAGDEYIQQLSRAAGAVVGVKRNTAAIAELKGRLLSGAAATAGQ
jgi:peptidyl-prolyl cis-trans isomerase D